jgi:hypothetical protein
MFSPEEKEKDKEERERLSEGYIHQKREPGRAWTSTFAEATVDRLLRAGHKDGVPFSNQLLRLGSETFPAASGVAVLPVPSPCPHFGWWIESPLRSLRRQAPKISPTPTAISESHEILRRNDDGRVHLDECLGIRR